MTPLPPQSIPWTFRYDGNIVPTTNGAIAYSNGTAGRFVQGEGRPSLSTDGSLLHFASLGGDDGLVEVNTTVPSGTGTTMNLDPSVGYTIEFRARLNSTNEAASNGSIGLSAATVQIENGTSIYTVSLGDVNGSTPGYVVELDTTHAQVIAVPDGFHTFRLTVLNTVAAFYIDGKLALTDFTGAYIGSSSLSQLRIGDFTGTADADWDLDYLYVYDGGAIAVPEPMMLMPAMLMMLVAGHRRSVAGLSRCTRPT
jgi:hypothetical protein